MNRKADRTMRSIDFIGGAIVASLAGAALWLTFVEGERVQAEVSALRDLLLSAEQDRMSLRAAQQHQLDTLADRQRDLDRIGRFPERPPIEAYFQFLSRRAAQQGLSVIRHQPIAERRYPGLIEHCFAYDATGPYPAIARFLREIEDSEHWADVGFLKIDRGPHMTTTDGDTRMASLTISLFSAPPATATENGGG
jgi:hypothetical protein